MPEYYGQNPWGYNPYVRPRIVEWQSPGHGGYPGYNPYDWSAAALLRDTQRYYQWQTDQANRMRPADYTRWAEQNYGYWNGRQW